MWKCTISGFSVSSGIYGRFVVELERLLPRSSRQKTRSIPFEQVSELTPLTDGELPLHGHSR
jgi:hypothetical protein